MADYIQIEVNGTDDVIKRELAIAALFEAGCYGFEEEGDVLKAFMEEADYEAAAIETLAKENNFTYSVSTIKEQNWNSVWESQFEPVVVNDFAAIRASFHEPITQVQHEIVITPKMSFGTGHHATTYMMIEQMAQLDFTGKKVFDFGTGTGILAILAEKMGAAAVLGIDNDSWSIENALENVQANHCSNITIAQNDHPRTEQLFDIILANINKHILLAYMSDLAVQLQPGGHLLLSGLLEEDETDIIDSVKGAGMLPLRTVKRSKWICIAVSK
ncbi:[LSU ribosomal protein L11P]-lysine N-methyltransferase [Filimonas lacunae]|uniref:Ribosomal protein L11 methyltransferase n=1 Tax=Filimonas lacunae TaxID=477680 RepID=A0A1N7R199_9BACT|nr:50S ribosomal protein L11 methyltransferase [Filimonas lacunae]SIT28880.1 [LSU ribosomal protein L11P]-lysine N-methyltransferase [Filimonas lacunae]